MSSVRFIINSLKHFAKQHLIVFFAVLVSAAVLTGALVVGDSVKLSLQKNVNLRLGSAEMALSTADRFITLETAHQLQKELTINSAAILNARGMAINSSEDLRLNKIQVYGVGQHFWDFTDTSYQINYGEAVVSKSLADELKLNIEDRVLLRIQKTGLIPLNAPFTSDEDPSVSLRLKIVNIAERENLGGFSLRNQQATAYNIFVNQEQLAERLDLKGYCNLILAEKEDKDKLNQTFAKIWNLKDAALEIKEIEEPHQLEIISDRVFIDQVIINASDEIEENSKVLSYFVNELNQDSKSTPYSFVSGIENQSIKKDHLIINSWLADDLKISEGDSIQLKYVVIGPLRRLMEKEKTFFVQEVLPMRHPLFSKNLMPDFSGLSTAGNCSDWDAGIPIDLDKIRDKDEKYWDDFKGTPKALISLEQAVELWKNPYGNYTSIRFSEETNKTNLEQKLLKKLEPIDFGFQFLNVKKTGQAAANNGVDFGGLFLSLSFFVIASALLLLVLVLRLQLENRASETGMLFSMGFKAKKIIQLRWLELLPSILLGSLLGAFFGIVYNLILIEGLNSIWNQAVHTPILEAFVVPKTIFIGFVISVILSGFIIWLTIRKQIGRNLIGIIREQKTTKSGSIKQSLIIGLFTTFVSIIMSLYAVFTSIEQNSSMVLTAGFLLLVGLIFLLRWFWLHSKSKKNELNTLLQLADKNIRRNLSRSISVVVLLALGTFTVIITGANRKTFNQAEENRQSGTGGFQYWAETSIPILYDLNSEEGKKELALDDQEILDSCYFLQFRSKTGDDASCLNLNQVQQPQILGVNAFALDSLNAFSFAKQLIESNHPWLSLEAEEKDLVIPAIADQTVIQWGLIKSIGDTLQYFNEEGQVLKLVLVGGLNASIFQGNILISEKHFHEHFPSATGSSFMLINAPQKHKEEIKQMLSNDLSDFGMVLTETSIRLAHFYSVTNTYLSIFMILGGLGVIIGTIGLGIILLRNMVDRKDELLLLSSVGFTSSHILKIIIIENLILVLYGITIGFVSALIGILPSLLSNAFVIPGNFLLWILTLVFLSSLLWTYIFAKVVVKRL